MGWLNAFIEHSSRLYELTVLKKIGSMCYRSSYLPYALLLGRKTTFHHLHEFLVLLLLCQTRSLTYVSLSPTTTAEDINEHWKDSSLSHQGTRISGRCILTPDSPIVRMFSSEEMDTSVHYKHSTKDRTKSSHGSPDTTTWPLEIAWTP